MSSIYLIFVCLLVGYILRRYNVVETNGYKILNILIIYVALPALTLHYIPRIEINSDLMYPIFMPWINIMISWLFFGILGHQLKWSKALTGAMIMMSGFGNTSFMGLPIIQALYGKEGIETVIMVDQPGSFVALTTLGILIANLYSNQSKIEISSIVKNIIKFPPFIAFVLGIILNISGLQIPKDIDGTLEILAGLVVPLALISVGMQLKMNLDSVYWRYVGLSLGFKLVLFPIIIFTLYYLIFQQKGQIIEIAFLESAMAPMVTAGIIAAGYGLKPRFCSLILSVGIIVSFITVFGWYFVMGVLL